MAIVTGRIDNETVILGVLADRKQETVKKFLLTIPKALRKTVKVVCSDMYEGFINAAKEVFGKRVKIVVDRFHVAKRYRNSLETLRKQELNRLKEELSEEDYKKLKGVMWALRRNPARLTEEEKEVLSRVFHHSPLLKLAYDLCNELTVIFNTHIFKGIAKRRLKQWMKRVKESELHCFDSFLKT